MGEQFSPDYIEYMQSDEAKRLQQGREFGIGDWYIPRPDRPEPQLIKNRLDMSCRDVRWIKLFTLFQLIRVIEGAGWRWQRDMDEKWLIVKGAEYYRAEGWKDGDMLAAAQLAVRAVEEK